MISNYDPIIPRKRFNVMSALSVLGVIGMLFFIFFVAYYSRSNLYFAILIGTLFIFSIGFTTVDSLMFRARWQELATIYNYELLSERVVLTFKSMVKGRIKGNHFELSTFTRGGGRNRRHYTRILFRLTEEVASPIFSVVPRSIFHFNRELTGDAEFDKKYTVKNAPAETMRLVITHSDRLRQALLELARNARKPKFTFSGNTLEYEERGKVADPEYLQAVFMMLADLGPALVRHTRATAAVIEDIVIE